MVLYGNDMLLVKKNMELIKEVKSQLCFKYDMKDLGVAHSILGMDIKGDKIGRKLWLKESKYVDIVLKNFNM